MIIISSIKICRQPCPTKMFILNNLFFVFFQSTVEEICRVARILHSPHKVGHAQLVVDGSPGISFLLVAMAAHLSNYSLFHINPSRLAAPPAPSGPHRQGGKKGDDEYRLEHFKAEISAAYKRAGVNVSGAIVEQDGNV